jgi:hypothetical protein
MELNELANGQDSNESRDTLFLLGGAALVLFGAGLILSTPAVRRYLGGAGVGNLVGAALPDLERYMKLRAM